MLEYGVLYPQAGLYRKERAHHEVAWAVGGHCGVAGHSSPDSADLVRDLRKEVEALGADHVVLSSEAFSRSLLDNPDKVGRFLRDVAGDGYHLAMLVRCASSYHESLYFQRIRAWASGRVGADVPPLHLARRGTIKAPSGHLTVLHRALQLDPRCRVWAYGHSLCMPQLCAELSGLPEEVFAEPVKFGANPQWDSRALSLAYLLATHPNRHVFQPRFLANRSQILELFSDGGRASIFDAKQRASIDEAANLRLRTLMRGRRLPQLPGHETNPPPAFETRWYFSSEQEYTAKQLFGVSIGELAYKARLKLRFRRVISVGL